jgi:hypothetical protein
MSMMYVDRHCARIINWELREKFGSTVIIEGRIGTILDSAGGLDMRLISDFPLALMNGSKSLMKEK